MTGIEWESLHCQQSKYLLGGLCWFCPSLFPSLCFLAILGSVLLFLQPHLSLYFPFLPRFSAIDAGVAQPSPLAVSRSSWHWQRPKG